MFIYVLIFAVCLLASIVGAICGIGGGVIIKPVLDSLGIMNVSQVSFLSTCTVLAMASYTMLKGKVSKASKVEVGLAVPLSIGAVIGGLVGKGTFQLILENSSSPDKVGAIQSFCLIIVTFGTLIYTLLKNRIKTQDVKNITVGVIIGFILGLISAFLGIGGGPINLVVLFFFYSLDTKTAAENSLFIIFFSQASSVILSLATGKIPDISVWILLLMIAGGIGGGILGRFVNNKIEHHVVDKLFIGLMVVIVLISSFNMFKFMN